VAGTVSTRGRYRFAPAVGVAAIVLAATGVHAADGAPPPADSEPQGFARWFDTKTAAVFAIPEIDVSPHSGLTLGVIPTALHTNDRDEIDRILAPDLIHSQYFGWGARARVLGYPSPGTEWSVVGGLKERTEREFDARYATGLAWESAISWSVEGIYDRSGIPRFFGLGNNSVRRGETSYVDNQGRVDASIGWNAAGRVQLAYVARVRYVTILPSVLPGLVSIGTRYPSLNGLSPEHEIEHRLQLVYDSRNARTISEAGGRYVLYAGAASRALGSSFADNSIGVDARQFWPMGHDLILAWHTALRYMPSARGAPFWALSSLGGDRSVLAEREPLRAYGADRFVDHNLFATQVELRQRVAHFDAFATHLSLELAPFLDVGKVFASNGNSPLSHLHKGAGIGIRGLASPFVVGYVDIGFGHERLAVFSGIDYPF
jgi:surface antigen Omp85-like protein